MLRPLDRFERATASARLTRMWRTRRMHVAPYLTCLPAVAKAVENVAHVIWQCSCTILCDASIERPKAHLADVNAVVQAVWNAAVVNAAALQAAHEAEMFSAVQSAAEEVRVEIHVPMMRQCEPKLCCFALFGAAVLLAPPVFLLIQTSS